MPRGVSLSGPVLVALLVAGQLSSVTNSPDQIARSGAADLFIRVTDGEPVTDGGLSRGIAWGDFDGDGDPDLVVANTINWPQFLYRNDGDGHFTEIHEVPVTLAVGWTEGVNWVDYDNDGDLDLFLTNDRDTPNALFRNDGNGNLIRVETGELTADAASSRQGCWADYDLDGDLDVFVANGEGEDDFLYENWGDGTFRRLGEGPWIGKENEARTCGAADVTGDGLPDIYVGNFLGQDNAFYRNEGGLQFSEVTEGHFVNSGGRTYGISWVDFEQDGDLDLFVTNIATQDRNLLYENDGRGNFTLRDDLAVVSESRGPSKGHTWGDYDLDGDLDLFVANGTEGTEEIKDFDVKNFLYLNRGDGTFERVTEGRVVSDANISAGAAWADYDADGDLDLFVANWGSKDEDNALYRNQTSERSGRSWVRLRLEGRRSNRMGIGTYVRLQTVVGGRSFWQTRWMLSTTGYASQNEPIIHFGLGDATRIDSLEVRWPSGIVDIHTDVEPSRLWVAVEGGNLG